jgi:[ribosomal protein S18]-alanine N-acetyltransferase
VIVPARPDDGDVLADIHATCFPEPWSAADFAQFLRQPGVCGWVTGRANADAFILMRRVAEEAEVLTLAVMPNARRRGHAAKLLAYALEDLRNRGTASCYLEVAVDNAAARALYQAAGFTDCGTRRGYYERTGAANGDAVVMRRDL